MARLSQPRATVCKFPAHRDYAQWLVSATGYESGYESSALPLGHHVKQCADLQFLFDLPVSIFIIIAKYCGELRHESAILLFGGTIVLWCSSLQCAFALY